MPLFAATAAIFLSLAQAGNEPPIVVLGYPWAPFISPMGEPFRVRPAGDDPFARWFHQADRNRDGMLTADEMRADAERFFTTIDSNEDGQIDPEELVVYETEIAPEVQVNSRWKPSRAETAAEPKSSADLDRIGRKRARGDNRVDGYQIHGLQGAARYGLLNLPQPVASADADLNRGTTLEEFRRAAAYRFQLLDREREGRIALQQLETLLPSRPNASRQARPGKDARDSRIGLPVPMGN